MVVTATKAEEYSERPRADVLDTILAPSAQSSQVMFCLCWACTVAAEILSMSTWYPASDVTV